MSTPIPSFVPMLRAGDISLVAFRELSNELEEMTHLLESWKAVKL